MADTRCPEGYVWIKTCGCGAGKCVPANQAPAPPAASVAPAFAFTGNPR